MSATKNNYTAAKILCIVFVVILMVSRSTVDCKPVTSGSISESAASLLERSKDERLSQEARDNLRRAYYSTQAQINQVNSLILSNFK